MKQDKLIIYLKRAKGEDGYKTFSIRMKDELAEQLNQISTQTGYSRNALIVQCVRFAIEHMCYEEL